MMNVFSNVYARFVESVERVKELLANPKELEYTTTLKEYKEAKRVLPPKQVKLLLEEDYVCIKQKDGNVVTIHVSEFLKKHHFNLINSS